MQRVLLYGLISCWLSPLVVAVQPTPVPAMPEAKNWAEDFLANDPLSRQDSVTLDQLRLAIEDANQQAFVIERHFDRLQGVTDSDKLELLKGLLEHASASIRRQAIWKLEEMGRFEEVLREILERLRRSEDEATRDAALLALSGMPAGRLELSPEELQALIAELDSDDEPLRQAAMLRIQAAGVEIIPALLRAMQEAPARARRYAALTLAEILRSRFQQASFEPAAAAPGELDTTEATVPKGQSPASEQHRARQLEDQRPQTIRVFFGTNRERLAAAVRDWKKLLGYPIASLVMLWMLIHLGWSSRRTGIKAGCSTLALGMVIFACLAWSLLTFRGQLLDYWKVAVGPRFGPRRDAATSVHYGYCDVSIPPSHTVGELESAWIGPADETQHVILQATEELTESQFFNTLKERLEILKLPQQSCFVFIHGFNVSFENAARRTAQIHYDLKFQGVPIFFSWPSRASIRHYFSDRNEIELARYLIKQFLVDVAERTDAARIHVIAHSMGADATSRAIAELGERGKMFDQIILAAPDIDRDVFRTQLAPRLAAAANRTTMYCSQQDFALLASKTFNDAPRAGDSSRGVLVAPGMDTIDASTIDTDLLGHSYYGDCMPLIEDLRQMIENRKPPGERKLKAWPVAENLNYWSFTEELSPSTSDESATGPARSTLPP
jgi:esterase/lipase superfamily enzyme